MPVDNTDSLNISLIIPTYSRPGCIARVLNKLAGMQISCLEIIIVDSSDDDLTEEVCCNYPGENSLIYLRSEKGLTLQRNAGLQYAKGDIIGFFDDDIVPDIDFFEKIGSVFGSDPDIYGVTPYIYENNMSGRNGLAGIMFNMMENLGGRLALESICRKSPFNQSDSEQVIENVITNGCTFYKKEIFQEYTFASWMHGYCYGEDVEFGLRVSQKYKTVGAGQARLHHYHESSGRDNLFQVNKMRIYNFVRILDSLGKENNFLLKMFLLGRMNLCILLVVFISIVKIKFKSGCLIFCGAVAGNMKSLPILFSKSLKFNV